MKTVDVRELKNRLSEYTRHVRAGEGVLVTDRGEVVVELTPPGHGPTDSSVPPGILALAKRGLATLGALGDPTLYPAIPRTRQTAAPISPLPRRGGISCGTVRKSPGVARTERRSGVWIGGWQAWM